MLGASAMATNYFYVQPKSQDMSKVAPFSMVLGAATLPGAVRGEAYNSGAGYNLGPLAVISGDPALNQSLVTFTLTAGALPAGLVLSSAGTISGTPTVVGSSLAQVTASYKNATGAQTYTVAVSEPIIVIGQIAYTTPGVYSFVVPIGVSAISAVAVGGGSAGTDTTSIPAGLSSLGSFLSAGGGGGVAGGVVIAGAGWSGGNGPNGGGGAGGYAGVGGIGGGSGGGAYGYPGAGGGGVGLMGQGLNGAGGAGSGGAGGSGTGGSGGGGGGTGSGAWPLGGTGGSGGVKGDGRVATYGGSGGAYGGGGSHGGGGALAYVNSVAVTAGQQITVTVGSGSHSTTTYGGGGAVRIIWGPGRAFPSTLTTDQ